ncbi:MAG TPA: glycoside hydrolase family 97 protein [Lacipirellulaceae bacterium]
MNILAHFLPSMNYSQRRMVACLATAILCLLAAVSRADQSESVTSPNGTIEVVFSLRDGAPTYSVKRFGAELIRPSRLGFQLADAEPLDGNFAIESAERKSFDETWTQPWGEKKEIRNAYHELRVLLHQQDAPARQLAIVFRVFDDGVGFRYEWPEQPNLKDLNISDELTEFALPEDALAWWTPAYGSNHYEYLYKKSKISELTKVHTPLTIEMSSGVCLSIHEAALIDFASMQLASGGELKLKADLAPWSDGIRVKGKLPFRSPWRTIQIGDNAGDLITSYLILNLNEPCKLDDVSWIKPGKFMGVWWEMHLGRKTWSSGEKHGATTEHTKQLIDFAAVNGFTGVLAEGWNQGWDGDWTKNGDSFSFTKPYPDFDIEELAAYAKSKGVALIGHNETAGSIPNYERQLDDAFSMYERLGLGGVKTGYVNFGQGLKRTDDQGHDFLEWHYGQYMVRHYQRVTDEAAKHHLMLDVHEPIKPTGLRRTYPNLMSGEGARGQEYNAWSDDGGNPPEHETILPFTRFLAGPMDFTPGIFNLVYHEDRPNNRVNTTLAKQLALYVVLYSPLEMVPDLPENYERYPDAFKFIRDVPTDWEDTRVLHARIGDYVTIVRKQRGGDDWYLGSITDENGRILQGPLSFLDRNRRYIAEIYRDADNADWRSNPQAYKVESQTVDANTVLTLRLAPGGGEAIRFHPADSFSAAQQIPNSTIMLGGTSVTEASGK